METKTCATCRSTIPAEAKRCPNCRAHQMGPARKTLNVVGTVVLLILAAFLLLELVAPFWR